MGAEALATRKEAIDYAASSAFEHYDSDNDGSLSQFEFFLLLWDLKRYARGNAPETTEPNPAPF